jgi:DNA polymerase III gamma/tau subunit
MRDALSQADKLLAFAGNEPRLEDLRRLGGEAGTRELEVLLALVEAHDRPALLEKLQALEGDEEEVLEGLLAQVRAAALLAFCGEGTPFVALNGQQRALAAERGRRLGAERLELWLQELLRARERLRLLPGQERIVLELCLLELARHEQTLPLVELVQRLEALERRLGGAPAPARGPEPRALAPATSARPAAPPPAAPTAAPARPSEVVQPVQARAGTDGRWEAFLAELRKTHGALAEVLAHHGASRLVEDAGGRLDLRLGGLSPEEERLVSDRRNQRACSEAATRVFGRPLALASGGSAARPAESPRASPDPLTQRMVQDYEGTVEELS